MSSKHPSILQLNNKQSNLVEQGRRIRAIHEIISRPDLSFDQQIDAILELGCHLLGTEIGKLSKQDPTNNTSEFLNTVVLSELGAKRGMVIPLDKTFCQITFSSENTIAISHVDKSEHKDHPAVAFLGMQSYIGCSINIHGKKFGTVNFSSREPVTKEFTDADIDLVNLIGSWISVMMERNIEAEELRIAKKASEKSNQDKSIFLDNVSSEIRTPLTAILNFTEVVLENKQSTDERESALNIIRQSSEHLLYMVNDILDISNIDSDKLSFNNAEASISDLINDVKSVVKEKYKANKIKFLVEYTSPIPKIIKTDPQRLKQILMNLCCNSIKFTQSNSIKTMISYSEDSSSLIIKINDNDSNEIKRIFKPNNNNMKAIQSRYGDTDLGLTLASKLVFKMGGELKIKDENNQSNEFELCLPAIAASNKNKTIIRNASDIIESNQTKKIVTPKLSGRVLFADDSKLNQYVFKIYLDECGLTTDFVNNGRQAVQLEKENDYDLILMDMMMPVLSGVEAVQEIRENGCELPIVMLTANVTTRDQELCVKAGSNYFLSKPVDKQTFYDVLSDCLKSK